MNCLECMHLEWDNDLGEWWCYLDGFEEHIETPDTYHCSHFEPAIEEE